MSEYRLYFLDDAGHIRRAVELDCRDDRDAIAEARAHSSEHGTELWQSTRKVGSLMGTGDGD